MKFIVDGHHRFFSAQKIGIGSIPANQVTLPYGSYKTVADLMLSGKMPGFFGFMK